jgi:prepilin-type processing-associated H-X9-DG protein
MVQQDKVILDDRERVVRSNPMGSVAANCAFGAILATVVRVWLQTILLVTVVVEIFGIVLSLMAVGLGLWGLLLARRRQLHARGAATGLAIGVANLLLIPLVAYVLRPATEYNKHNEQCLANLRVIGEATAKYARYDSPEGLVPPSLMDLIRSDQTNGPSREHLTCPLDPDRPQFRGMPPAFGPTRRRRCSYTWVPNQKWGPREHVLAYCRGGDHGGGANCLMADGTVQWLTTDDLEAALARTAAALRAAGRRYLPVTTADTRPADVPGGRPTSRP